MMICSTGRWAFICQVTPLKFSSDDVAYNAMPIFHGNALMSALGPCLANGAAFAMRRRFSASGFLPDIRRFGATFFNYVGRSLAYVLAQPERPEESDNRLRFGFATEASARDRAEFSRRYGCPLLESYSSSEGSQLFGVASSDVSEHLFRTGSGASTPARPSRADPGPIPRRDRSRRLLSPRPSHR